MAPRPLTDKHLRARLFCGPFFLKKKNEIFSILESEWEGQLSTEQNEGRGQESLSTEIFLF